ncbi:MAG: tRNA uridine-5-carboxymethylaminomethyl(34) synthesis GTPase MnmE [Mycoplasmataceae bacterium]|jgi:tRNA modification GTPase|nr:tRNA uridine-5-carboxymethylaminomethyl(34) synthesis GTPase MnmE [Mycoplasmataceae bacterium]
MSTIVALATAPINCAIHIIRVSGEETYKIINQIVDKQITRSGYSIQRVNILDKHKHIDDVLIMKFVAPKSFTGEDLIEINCHGGIFLAKKIISLLIRNGAKMALPGDFSKRAFLNKKININQAQAINNLINANSDYAIDIANNGLNQQINDNFIKITESLFKIIGQLEVNIDYPEYDDVPQLTTKKIIELLLQIKTQLQHNIENSNASLKFLKGINLAIVGKPNVGKSSLLNALVNEEKAIVSNIPGTTRDLVEASFKLNDLTFNVIDTAGIRDKSDNKIEKIGIERSLASIDKADFILLVVDGSKQLDSADKKLMSLLKNKKHLIIANKSDLKKQQKTAAIQISAKNNNISNLLTALTKEFKNITINTNQLILQSIDCIEIVSQTCLLIQQCIDAMNTKQTIDIQMSKLHNAYENLLLITGATTNYNFITELFKKFCLGK